MLTGRSQMSTNKQIKLNCGIEFWKDIESGNQIPISYTETKAVASLAQ